MDSGLSSLFVIGGSCFFSVVRLSLTSGIVLSSSTFVVYWTLDFLKLYFNGRRNCYHLDLCCTMEKTVRRQLRLQVAVMEMRLLFR